MEEYSLMFLLVVSELQEGGGHCVDVGLDVGVNVGVDVGGDVGVDVGGDVGVDVGGDVGVDVGGDVGGVVGVCLVAKLPPC